MSGPAHETDDVDARSVPEPSRPEDPGPALWDIRGRIGRTVRSLSIEPPR